MVKKIIATVLSVGVIVSGISYSTASAATEKVTWNAYDNNIPGVPSSESKVGYATLHATSETYTGVVTAMSDIANRKLSLSCTTHTMSKVSPLVYNNTGKQSWKISGTISKVTYKMVASTSLPKILEVNGYIQR